MATKQTARPKVEATLEVEKELDLASALDYWTLEEIEAFIDSERDDFDGEGYYLLRDESDVVAEDVGFFSLPREAIRKYAAWRRENGITERKDR